MSLVDVTTFYPLDEVTSLMEQKYMGIYCKI